MSDSNSLLCDRQCDPDCCVVCGSCAIVQATLARSPVAMPLRLVCCVMLCWGVLQLLRDRADDTAFQTEWMEVKALAKKRAAAKIESLTGTKVNPNALFDVQVRLPGHVSQALIASWFQVPSACAVTAAATVFVTAGWLLSLAPSAPTTRVCPAVSCVCCLPLVCLLLPSCCCR